jgi:DNA-binding transcriptional ArsR family regulator
MFRALGDHARLRLLTRLIGGARCVTELAKEECEALSTISQRLRILRAENLVLRTRSGKYIHYALADRHVCTLVQNALAHLKEPSRMELGKELLRHQ